MADGATGIGARMCRAHNGRFRDIEQCCLTADLGRQAEIAATLRNVARHRIRVGLFDSPRQKRVRDILIANEAEKAVDRGCDGRCGAPSGLA
jgi:hypothetical protein